MRDIGLPHGFFPPQGEQPGEKEMGQLRTLDFSPPHDDCSPSNVEICVARDPIQVGHGFRSKRSGEEQGCILKDLCNEVSRSISEIVLFVMNQRRFKCGRKKNLQTFEAVFQNISRKGNLGSGEFSTRRMPIFPVLALRSKRHR